MRQLPLYALSIAYYNVYYHPLASFPGPWLWTAFRLPHVVSRLRGRNHKDTLEQFRKYGPVVRIAPDELAFSQPDAWRDINARSGKYAENVKDINAWPPMQPGWDKSLPLASEDLHRRLRRTYGPAFTTQAVQEQERMILRYVNLFIDQLGKAVSGNPVQNIDKWFNFFTFDIMGDFAFGQSFKSLENSEYHSWVGSVLENVHLGIIVTQLQRYGLWSILEQLVPKSWFAARDTCNDYVQQVVDRRLEKGHLPGKVDLFNYLLQRKDDDETTLSRQDLCANAFFIVMAGSETVATLLTGLTWFLCSNPDTLALATREARLTYTNSEEIDIQTASRLRYINAVLKEGLRIFPPAAEGSPRVISSPIQPIAGYEVPMGVRDHFLRMIDSTLTSIRPPAQCRLTLPTITKKTSLGLTSSSQSDG